jgi:hypothetical protein
MKIFFSSRGTLLPGTAPQGLNPWRARGLITAVTEDPLGTSNSNLNLVAFIVPQWEWTAEEFVPETNNPALPVGGTVGALRRLLNLEYAILNRSWGRQHPAVLSPSSTNLNTPFPTGGKFLPGIVKSYPAGGIMGTNFLDKILGSSVALEDGRWRGRVRPHSATRRT